MSEPLAIGVDGGGTKTAAWLTELRGEQVLGRGLAGPGNPRSAGFDAAEANIAAAIHAAFVDAGLERQSVAAACFGLAGAGRPAEQDRIARWARETGIAQVVRVTGDAEPILAAGAPENCGIALIGGTGSLAWGRNAAGRVARSGGWGYLIGDEGSGYAIALAGLRAAARAADGRGPPTLLLAALQARLPASSPEQIVERVYAPEMTREQLAALAAVVCDLAGEDGMARQIVDRAASDLAEMVAALAKELGFSRGEFPLAVAGGVLLGQPLLRERVLGELLARQAQPASITLVAEPVRGAVLLARRLASC